MEKVSIVIPIYNVKESYMKKCMVSILNQTYTDLEVLLVDDGSVHETAVLCDSYAMQDGRVKVIHQPNQGVSYARNNGTLHATGKYIMYSDSDDILLPYAVEDGVKHIKETNADMVIAAVTKISPDDTYHIENSDNFEIDLFGTDGASIDNLREYYLLVRDPRYKKIGGNSYIGRGPWARLIKSDIAKKNPFPYGLPLGEDVIWNMNFTNLCEKICVLLKPWYEYVIYDSSSMRKYYGGNRETIVTKYLTKLWDDNAEYMEKHVSQFGKNAAMEFYFILRYELLSEKNELLKKEKNNLVASYLSKWPWNLLKRIDVFFDLPLKYKIMVILCRMNMWQEAIRLLK